MRLTQKTFRSVDLEQILKSIANPVRRKILQSLKENDNNPMSLTQIKNNIKNENNEYNDGQLWKHLNYLLKSGMVYRKKERVINESTGKPTIWVYGITEEGVLAIEYFNGFLKSMHKLSPSDNLKQQH